MAEVDQHEVAALGGPARFAFGEVSVITGTHLGPHRHRSIPRLHPGPVRVVPAHHVQVRTGNRTAHRGGRSDQMQVAAAKAKGFSDA